MTFDRQGKPRPAEFDMFVIDVLRYDIEDVDAVLRMLNNSGSLGWRKFSSSDFTREEVKAALARLIEAGLVKPLEYDPTERGLVDVQRSVDVIKEGDLLWYKLEDSALDLWNEWKPKDGID